MVQLHNKISAETILGTVWETVGSPWFPMAGEGMGWQFSTPGGLMVRAKVAEVCYPNHVLRGSQWF